MRSDIEFQLFVNVHRFPATQGTCKPDDVAAEGGRWRKSAPYSGSCGSAGGLRYIPQATASNGKRRRRTGIEAAKTQEVGHGGQADEAAAGVLLKYSQ